MDKGQGWSGNLLFYKKILKMESGCSILRVKRGCLKRWRELVLIKSQKVMEQRSQIKRSTILDEKVKIKSLFYIKSQKRVPVNHIKKINHPIKGRDREPVPYQKLRMV